MKRTGLFVVAFWIAACSSSSSLSGGGEDTNGGDDGGGASDTDATTGGGGGGGGSDSGGGGSDAGTASDSGEKGDANESDGGATMEGGADGGAVSCTGMAYCEDFESYSGAIKNATTLGPWKASVGGNATGAVDAVKPYSGAKSLHITIPVGTAANVTLNQTKAAGLVTGNDLYGRAMVFYSTSGTNDLPVGVHSWIFNAAGNSVASGGNVTMNVANNGTNYFLNYHPAKTPELSVTGGKPTGGVWLCMQWQYDGSGTPPKDEAKIWVDGTLVVDATPAKKWDFAVPWSTFDFGLQHYQTTTKPLDVYLDDFALNDTMVACPK